MLKIILRPANLHRRRVDKPRCLEGGEISRAALKTLRQAEPPGNDTLQPVMCLKIVMCAPGSQLLRVVTYAAVIYGDAAVERFLPLYRPTDLQVIPKTLIVHHVRLLFGFVSVLRSVTGSLSGVSTSAHVTSSSPFCM